MSDLNTEFDINEISYHVDNARKIRSRFIGEYISKFCSSGVKALISARSFVLNAHLPKWVKMKPSTH